MLYTSRKIHGVTWNMYTNVSLNQASHIQHNTIPLTQKFRVILVKKKRASQPVQSSVIKVFTDTI
jgi:hypothetical protein